MRGGVLLDDEDGELRLLRLTAGRLRRVAEVAHVFVLLEQVGHCQTLRRFALLVCGRTSLCGCFACGATGARGFRWCAAFVETAAQRFHDVDDFAAFLFFLLLRFDRL